jgi:hypothetical protein
VSTTIGEAVVADAVVVGAVATVVTVAVLVLDGSSAVSSPPHAANTPNASAETTPERNRRSFTVRRYDCDGKA